MNLDRLPININYLPLNDSKEGYWLESLPLEIFSIILSDVNYIEMPNIALSCKFWNERALVIAKNNQILLISSLAKSIIDPISPYFPIEGMQKSTCLTLSKINESWNLQEIHLAKLILYKKFSEDLKGFNKTLKETFISIFKNWEVMQNPEMTKYSMHAYALEKSYVIMDDHLKTLSNSFLDYNYTDHALVFAKLILLETSVLCIRNITGKLYETGKFEKLLQTISDIAYDNFRESQMKEMALRFKECGNLLQEKKFTVAQFKDIMDCDDLLVLFLPFIRQGFGNELIDFIKTKPRPDYYLAKFSKRLILLKHADCANIFIDAISEIEEKIKLTFALADAQEFEKAIEIIEMLPKKEMSVLCYRDISIKLMRMKYFAKAMEFALITPAYLYKEVLYINDLCNLVFKLAQNNFADKANEMLEFINDKRMKEFTIARIKALSKS